jgi:methyl-accepting chemotaxis protein
MNEAVAHTATGTQQVIDRAEKARTAVNTSSEQFQGMVQDFESTHNDLLRVGATVEQLSVENRNIHNRSTEIRDLAIKIHQDMDRSSTHATELRTSTDETLLKLCQFRIGRGYLESTLETLEERRDVLQEAIERLLDEGVDMFDRNHIPVPNTEPQKYEVGYAHRFQETCQHLVDQWRDGIEGAIYCLPLDSEGFVAIHLSEVSQPPTGDPKIDLQKSRNMRFFDKRRLSHEGRFLLQSYLRDTGDVMFNLSVPIIAHGTYWGGLYLGLPSKTLGLD